MPELNHIPTKEDIEINHKKIADYIHQTPVLTSTTLNTMFSSELFFKCENFQKAGSFKYRGAITSILNLDKQERKLGVATHSSGNHGQAIAKASQKLGVRATVIMPKNAPQVKVDAVKGYGAEVIFCENNLASRETTLKAHISRTGAIEIHPFNNYNVILGQSSCAKELIEQTQDLDVIIAPIGGGGLCSGTVLSSKNFGQGVTVIGAEPKLADDAYQSFEQQKLIPLASTNITADGLRTSLGTKTFDIIKTGVEDILTVKEETILIALKLVWERMKIIIEPSCAVPLAAVMENQGFFKNKKVGLILTGGNVDVKKVAHLIPE